MDEQYIRQNSIIERYLLQRLSDQEQYEFEQYYFEHPELMKELERARAMRDGFNSPELRERLMGVSESALGARRDEPTEGKGTIPWPQRLLGLISNPAWSVPVTAAACIMAVLLAVQRPPSPSAPLPVVAELTLERMRGEPEETLPEASIARSGGVALRIDATGLDAATLKGTLRSGTRTIAELPLIPDPDSGQATVVLPSSILPPGAYTLELSDGRGIPFAYEFRINP